MFRRVGTEALSSYVLPYILDNNSTCIYEHLMAQDAFVPLRQCEILIPLCYRFVPVFKVLMKLLWDAMNNPTMWCILWHTFAWEM